MWRITGRALGCAVLCWLLCGAGGGAPLRVTRSPPTADEEYLLTQAATRSIAKLPLDALRGRSVWVLTEYAFSTPRPFDESFLTNQVRSPTFENAYLIGELRARLLQVGARLASYRDEAEVILEVRVG